MTEFYPSYKVGYYDDTVCTSIHAETGLSVWVPLVSSHEGPLAGPYTVNFSCRKALLNVTGMDIGLLPDGQRLELPSIAYTATSTDAASPRGIILYLHGVATTRWDQFKLAEEFASAGYIFAAPGFANSSANDRTDMMASFGGGMATGGLFAESLTLRVHTMECVRAHLQKAFGDLPFGMYGHSMGAMTTSLLNWDVPKCLISGGMGPEGFSGGVPHVPFTYTEAGRTQPWPVSQGSASLVFASKSGDMMWPETVQPGFTFETIELADEEASSVPQTDLPNHCMIVVDGISHTAWLTDVVHYFFRKVKPFDTVYETTGIDALMCHDASQARGPALNENVMKPLIKRFFEKNVKK